MCATLWMDQFGQNERRAYTCSNKTQSSELVAY